MKRLLLCLLVCGLLTGCGSSRDAKEESQTLQPAPAEAGGISQRGQLMGPAEDEAQAQEIAELYGIALVDYAYGLALYYTDQDPKALIELGQENGWPPLSLNRTMNLY